MSEPKVQLTHRTVRGMLWMAWAKGANAVLQMVILAVVARLLLPAEFGVVTAALVVIGFAGVFSQLGLGPAVVQRTTLERRHIDSAFSASVLFGLILGTATWTAASCTSEEDSPLHERSTTSLSNATISPSPGRSAPQRSDSTVGRTA